MVNAQVSLSTFEGASVGHMVIFARGRLNTPVRPTRRCRGIEPFAVLLAVGDVKTPQTNDLNDRPRTSIFAAVAASSGWCSASPDS